MLVELKMHENFKFREMQKIVVLPRKRTFDITNLCSSDSSHHEDSKNVHIVSDWGILKRVMVKILKSWSQRENLKKLQKSKW